MDFLSSARRALPAAVVAAACVALAALPAWASAGEGTSRHRLEVESLQVGTKAGPVSVRVKARPAARVDIWVNGRAVEHDFEFAGDRAKAIELRRADGLVPGVNRLRIRSHQGASTLTARRTVRLSGVDLLADAGEDLSATAQARARVGAAPLMGASNAGVEYRWHVVGRPRGARAMVAVRRDMRPVLHASQPGTYVLQLEANPEGPGPASSDQVNVTVAPEDPPIGVPINTIGAQNAITIAGRSFGASAGGARTAYVVLQRTTREPALDANGKEVSGSVPNDAKGMAELAALAKAYGEGGNFMNYLMIVSGKEMPKGEAADFGRLAKSLGAALLSEEDFTSLAGGRQYSIIGIPGAPEGAATVRIPGANARGYSAEASGAITGFLQELQTVNVDGTPVYNFVSPENPSFDTRSSGTLTTNAITVAGATFTESLPAGATAGFQTTVVDPTTLKGVVSLTVPTNASTGSARELQGKAAATLKSVIDLPGKPLIFVQTIGKPKAAGPEWEGVVSQLARLGANRVLVNALDGTTEYALVGHVDSSQPVAESSTAYDHGPNGDPKYPAARLVGALARTRNSRFEVTVSSTPTPANPGGMVNLGLMALPYQDPQGFPSLVARANPPAKPGEGAAAEDFICKQLGFCQPANSCPDIRSCYWQKYGSTAWGTKHTELATLDYPGDGRGFEKTVFLAVRTQLLTEIAALATDKAYLAQLQEPFEKSEGAAFVDLNDISQKVWDSLQRPKGSNTTSWVLGLIGKAVAVGGVAGPPLSAAAAGLAATFGLASYLSTETGQPVLGAEVKAEASKLGSALVERVNLARQASFGLGKIVASDYGKLIDLNRHAATDWSLPENPLSVATQLRIASKQWMYESLVPVAYPYLIRGNNDATKLDCRYGDRGPGWPNQPASAEMWVTVGYDNSGNPIKGMYFFTRGIGGAASPPASLADDMFKLRTAGGLGMEKLTFFTPQVFGGKVAHAVNTAPRCELGGMPVEK